MNEPPLVAPWPRSLRAQLRVELLLLLRQPENLLVILVLPVLLLALFAGARIFPAGAGRPADFLIPGVITVALMSTGMVTLGISTAYQRYYRVLKRLGGSPLPTFVLVLAKAGAVLLVEIGQVALLLVIGRLFFGWSGAVLGAIPLMLLGSVCFAGLGLTLAGALRAELTLGGANGLYLLFLVVGGVVLPIDHLPTWLQPVAGALPPALLSSSLRAALGSTAITGSTVLLLAVWTVVLAAAASLLFRWE